MLSSLKFVKGSVAKKDLVPELTHFKIENGTVRGYNGTIALCAPIPLDLNCTPKAQPLIKAIENCNDETVSLTITGSGKLSIKSGKFKAAVECIEDETPHVKPEGNPVPIDGEALIKALKTIQAFISDDASRPWSAGVLLKDYSAFATNNVCLIQYWIGSQFPLTCNIPKAAVKELVRIGDPPTHVSATENSISFYYDEHKWMRAQLLTTEWPDLEKVLNREANYEKINPELFEGLDFLKPFCDKYGRIFTTDTSIRTHLEKEEGASYRVDGFSGTGCFRIEMLQLLQSVCEYVDFTDCTTPCLFYSKQPPVRGAIIGMKL